MDREFYRAVLIKKLRNEHLPVIIPAKKFLRVQNQIRQNLLETGKLVSFYHFRQIPKARPWPSTVHVNIVIVGHNDQPPWEIRQQYRENLLTFDDALHKLTVFSLQLTLGKKSEHGANG